VLTAGQTGKKEVLFDATHAKHTAPIVRPLEEQDERESQKLWYSTVQAIKESNHTAATEEKTKIEDRQRDETAKRAEQGVEWQPKLFRKVRGGPGGPEEGEEDLDWILNANMLVWARLLSYTCANRSSDGQTPEAKTKQILAIAPILKGQRPSQQPQPPQQSQAAQSQHAQSPPQPQQQPPQAQHQSAENSDLIDFGPADSQATSIPPRNSSLQQQPVQQTVQQPMNAPAGLQEPMQPGQPLKRVDTLTKDLDEFVDAPAP